MKVSNLVHHLKVVWKTTANPINTDCNSGTATTYDDVVDVSVGYSGNFEGVDISLTYGNVTGNTEIDKAGSDAGAEYNDLENHTYSVKVAAAGFTGYRLNSYADSGAKVATQNDGDGEGTVYAIRYDMGNISLGYVHNKTEVKTGTNASASTAEMDMV